ncbi:POK9 protein, partial [Acrocephalus arundinaceus]|nr:POK9 protein [Acrocephalus arundinaceus]
GSLGVDVATAVEVTLQDKEVTLIPTNVYGPMYSTISLLGGLLLGRSSTSKQGVIVIPGVIDADYTGQVQIMAYALQPPVTIPKGSKIAQILPFENTLPHRQQPREPNEKQREDGSFGSTGHDVFFTIDLSNRPHKKVQLQCGSHCITLQPMLDTGADISIVN